MLCNLLCFCLLAVASALEAQTYLPPPISSVPLTPVASFQHTAPSKYEFHKEFYFFSDGAKPNKHTLKKAFSQYVPKSAQTEVNYGSYKIPAAIHQQLQQIVQQHGGDGYVVDLGEHVSGTQNIVSPVASNINRQYLAPAVANVQSQQQHSKKTEIHFINYKTPAEAQQIQQQIAQKYGAGHVVDLGEHVSGTNLNTQYLAPAATNVNSQFAAPAVIDVPADTNLNSQILAPATSNVKSEYLPPASSSQQFVSLPSNVNSEYLPPSASNVNREYIPPRFFFKH